jgi:Tubulin-tyrosine ligase family
MSFYVKTGQSDFDDEVNDYFEEKGWKASKSFPVNFIYITGEAAYQRNRFDTKKSNWISLLWGKSVERLTNKYELHKHHPKASFLIPTKLIDQGESLPRLPTSFLKILKPVEGFSGSGIKIVQSKDEVAEWLESHSDLKEWVLQDYITTPALKEGRKFHLRVFVIVRKEHGKDPQVFVANHKIYNKAEENYKQGDWLNPKIHDTHFKGRVEFFPNSLPDDWSEDDGLKAQKKINLILKKLLEDEKDFKPEWNAKNGFEVFGVDILFDEHNPYILEFNHKMGHKSAVAHAKAFVDTVLTNESNQYFTRIL